MTESSAESTNQGPESLRNQVRSAVIWRSGTQILGQIIAWGATFLVIRLLDPSDYGLFAMTQVVLVLLNFAWFWPIWTNELLTHSQWLDRIWFGRWI